MTLICRFIDHQVCQVTIIHFGTIYFIIFNLKFTFCSLHNIFRKITMRICHKRKEIVVVCLQRNEHSNFIRFLNSHLSCVAHFKIGILLLRNYDHHVPNDAWYNEQTRNENDYCCRLSIQSVLLSFQCFMLCMRVIGVYYRVQSVQF